MKTVTFIKNLKYVSAQKIIETKKQNVIWIRRKQPGALFNTTSPPYFETSVMYLIRKFILKRPPCGSIPLIYILTEFYLPKFDAVLKGA